MDKNTLRTRIERRRAMMGNDEMTIKARNKLAMGEALTAAESARLFAYIRRLETKVDGFYEK